MRFSWKRVSFVVIFGIFNYQLFLFISRAEKIEVINPIQVLWPDNRRIFFHETTGRSDLNARQNCAVESAAKHNPDRPVQLFLQTDQVNEANAFIQVLRKYSNVQIIAFNVADYFNNTPLNDWFMEGQWKNSSYSREHFSDYIRMLSLHKGGGMYMDLDFVSIKPMPTNKFWNFVPSVEENFLTGSVIHLEHGHQVLPFILKRLATDYRPDLYIYQGPQLVNDVVRQNCKRCKNLRVSPVKFFYPIPYAQWVDYFRNDTSEDLWTQVNRAYAVHVWNKLSEQNPAVKGSNQIYSRLAEIHCPLTYEAAGTSF